jgi:hypothetical protein
VFYLFYSVVVRSRSRATFGDLERDSFSDEISIFKRVFYFSVFYSVFSVFCFGELERDSFSDEISIFKRVFYFSVFFSVFPLVELFDCGRRLSEELMKSGGFHLSVFS